MKKYELLNDKKDEVINTIKLYKALDLIGNYWAKSGMERYYFNENEGSVYYDLKDNGWHTKRDFNNSDKVIDTIKEKLNETKAAMTVELDDFLGYLGFACQKTNEGETYYFFSCGPVCLSTLDLKLDLIDVNLESYSQFYKYSKYGGVRILVNKNGELAHCVSGTIPPAVKELEEIYTIAKEAYKNLVSERS